MPSNNLYITFIVVHQILFMLKKEEEERINTLHLCKDSKNKSPSPLRSVVPCPSNQAQTIEFLIE